MTSKPSIDDVAAAIFEHFDRPITTMKLQKLAYLAQGWNLAFRGAPMFEGKFEAWVNGPVSRELYRKHRGEFSRSRWPEGNPKALSDEDRVILDAVIDNYGGLSGAELSDLTHVAGTPWHHARALSNVGPTEPSREALDENLIRTHFRQLLGLDDAEYESITDGEPPPATGHYYAPSN